MLFANYSTRLGDSHADLNFTHLEIPESFGGQSTEDGGEGAKLNIWPSSEEKRGGTLKGGQSQCPVNHTG